MSKRDEGRVKTWTRVAQSGFRLRLLSGPASKSCPKLHRAQFAINHAIRKLQKEMESATPAAAALTSALTDGVGQAVDYMLSGFKDGLKGLLNIFKSTIMQMISYALKNKIMIALGIGGAGGGIGSVAAAATGGGKGGAGSGLLSSITGGGGILGSLGTGLFGATPVLGTGLLGGLGSTLSATFGAGGGIGGLFGIGANAAAAGGGLMAGLGAALPVIGIAAAVFSFFKTKTKLLDEGIRGTISMEAAMFDSYQKIQKTKFWGLSKKTSYKYAALSADASAPMVAAVNASQDAVLNSAEALGFAASIFDGFSYKFQLSLKGPDDAAKQAKVVEELTKLSDAMAGMVAGLGAFKLSGEGSAEALTRLSTNLVAVNDVFRDLGFSLQAISLAGGDASYQFAQVFGGLDAMASATEAYYNAFYSDQERLANATARLGEQLAALGYNAIPATYSAFRQMVDDVMASGDQILGANLIQISSLFDQVKSAEAQLAEQRLQSLGALEDRFSNGFDYQRAKSRVVNGADFSKQDTGVTSPEQLSLLKTIASSLQIIAADTSRNVGATEDLLAVTLGGVTA
jgi:trimeric autotransporter adhesin